MSAVAGISQHAREQASRQLGVTRTFIGRCAVEGEPVGRGSHDGAVLVVELEHAGRADAFELRMMVWPLESCASPRSGEGGAGVEEEVVDAGGESGDESLLVVSVWRLSSVGGACVPRSPTSRAGAAAHIQGPSLS